MFSNIGQGTFKIVNRVSGRSVSLLNFDLSFDICRRSEAVVSRIPY